MTTTPIIHDPECLFRRTQGVGACNLACGQSPAAREDAQRAEAKRLREALQRRRTWRAS
jgi:hypothetical protein